MGDHKKRNWQRLMHDRADQVMELCMEMPVRADINPTEALRNRFREAYILGFRDGRDSKKK